MKAHTTPSSAAGAMLAGAGLLAGVLAGLAPAGLDGAKAAPVPAPFPPSVREAVQETAPSKAPEAGSLGQADAGGVALLPEAAKISVSKNISLQPVSASGAAKQEATQNMSVNSSGGQSGSQGEGSSKDAVPLDRAGMAQRQSRRQAQIQPQVKAQSRPEDEERALRDQLLEESIERLLPLEPGEIRTYIERRDSVEGAIQPGPARMRTETRKISAVPGAAPQVIRLTAGYSSTLIFQDASGEPWPVAALILGDAKAFQASQPGHPASASQGPSQGAPRSTRDGQGQAQGASYADHANLVTLVPLTNHASSNLVVALEGAPYPVILHLLTESSAKQARVEDALVVFRLDTPGPRASQPAIGPAQPGPVTRELLNLVHGIPPEGATRLRLEPELWGTDCWEHGARRYLRTGHQPVWPAWSAQAGQAVKVYVMPKTPGIVLSVNGRRVSLAVGGRGASQGGGR